MAILLEFYGPSQPASASFRCNERQSTISTKDNVFHVDRIRLADAVFFIYLFFFTSPPPILLLRHLSKKKKKSCRKAAGSAFDCWLSALEVLVLIGSSNEARVKDPLDRHMIK